VLVLSRFPESAVPDTFEGETADLLVALGDRPGFLGGRLIRSTDEGGGWILVLEWASVGDWRRAFSPFDLRLRAMEFFARAEDEGSAYEVLLEVGPGGAVLRGSSDRASRQRGHDAGDSL
jgi:hypothetical protein